MTGADVPAAAPVGDWMRRRYPPNDGTTHYLGEGDDPGCCAGPHPMCTYDAGYREGRAAALEWAARQIEQHANMLERIGARPERVATVLEAAGLLRQGGEGGTDVPT